MLPGRMGDKTYWPKTISNICRGSLGTNDIALVRGHSFALIRTIEIFMLGNKYSSFMPIVARVPGSLLLSTNCNDIS